MRSSNLAAKPKWAGIVKRGQRLLVVHGDHGLEKGSTVYFKELEHYHGDWFALIAKKPRGTPSEYWACRFEPVEDWDETTA